jgi:hypothetical protein
MFCSGTSLENIVSEQFQLAKRSNISITESTMMSEFEREAYVNLLIKEIKREQKNIPTE